MQISFTGHNVEVTPAIRDFAENKLSRLERRFNNITSIHVTFDVEKLLQIAEATVHVPKAELHARAEAEDLYSAIDDLIDKLDRQIIKHKEKVQNHQE